PPQSPPQKVPTQRQPQKVSPQSPVLKAFAPRPRPSSPGPHLMVNHRVLARGGALAGLLLLAIGYFILRPGPPGMRTVQHALPKPTESSPRRTPPHAREPAPPEPPQKTTPATPVTIVPEASAPLTSPVYSPARVGDPFAPGPLTNPNKAPRS